MHAQASDRGKEPQPPKLYGVSWLAQAMICKLTPDVGVPLRIRDRDVSDTIRVGMRLHRECPRDLVVVRNIRNASRQLVVVVNTFPLSAELVAGVRRVQDGASTTAEHGRRGKNGSRTRVQQSRKQSYSRARETPRADEGANAPGGGSR